MIYSITKFQIKPDQKKVVLFAQTIYNYKKDHK